MTRSAGRHIQGVHGVGMSDAANPLATVMAKGIKRKLTRVRVRHAQTREYMEVNGLKGAVSQRCLGDERHEQWQRKVRIITAP